MSSWNDFTRAARIQLQRPQAGDVQPVAPQPVAEPEPQAVAAPAKRDLASVASARAGLAAYLAAYGKALAPTGTEIDRLMPSAETLRERGAKLRANLDSQAPVPNEAYRPAQGNPAPWMREHGRPVRSHHARRRG